MLRSLVDTALDRSIVGGYTRLGYRVRRRWFDELPRMDGKVVLVTGATAGIGLAAAEAFAGLGAAVRLLARDADRGARSRDAIATAAGNDDVAVVLGDLSDLASVRTAAAAIAQEPRLDVLVNNAGVLPPERTLSADGIELTFATNVLGPFLLTQRLLELLKRSAPARIVNVSSGGMYSQRLRPDDLQFAAETFDGTKAYARTKRAEVILTEMEAERLEGTGVVVHAMHPGWVDTPGVQTSLPRFRKVMGPFLRDPQAGADTIVWLGAADEPARSSGRFWHDRRVRPTHLVPWTRETPEDRERLWSECERLVE
jgi:NAD(P)-dependent dehydrogenase (short-subunit alcohol dehydrogenase family)